MRHKHPFIVSFETVTPWKFDTYGDLPAKHVYNKDRKRFFTANYGNFGDFSSHA